MGLFGAFHLVVQEMNVIEASKREQASRRKQLTVAARTGVSHGFRGSREGERRTSSIYYSQGTESRRDPAGETVGEPSVSASAVNASSVNASSVNASCTPISCTPAYSPATPVTSTQPIHNTQPVNYTQPSIPYSQPSNNTQPISNIQPITNTPINTLPTTTTQPTIDSLHTTVIEQEAPLDDADQEEEYDEYDEEQRKSCIVA